MLGDTSALLGTAVLSIVIWVVNALGVEATFRAFSLDLPAYASFLLLGVIAVALVLPSAPGYVGPFQAGTVQGLALVHTDGNVTRLRVSSQTAVAHSSRHAPLVLEPGDYMVTILRERGDAEDRQVED